MTSTDDEIDRLENSGTALGGGCRKDTLFSAEAVKIAQKLLAETIGTFFLVFGGCGSVVINKMHDGALTFPGICVAWGLAVMVMVYSVGHISGGHFNPAVTLTFTVLRRFPWKQLPLYVISQMVGAILASGTLFLLFDPKPEHFYGTTPTGSVVQSFILEIIISFLLMFVISGVATDSRAIGELAGIAVGSTILLNVLVAGPVSGASMNPARSLGPAIVMGNFKAIWAYILGPTIGTLAGGCTYNLIRYTDKPLRELTKSGSFLKGKYRDNI